jgi:hypothetical protein
MEPKVLIGAGAVMEFRIRLLTPNPAPGQIRKFDTLPVYVLYQ